MKFSKFPEAVKIKEILHNAKRIVVVQADNPDGDSLASALALEQILGDMNKEPFLYCGLDMPAHLRYLPGWDRVSKDLPHQFDASIIVDTSSDSLVETLERSGQKSWIASKPVIVLDHHPVEPTITYATTICCHPAVATGEIIYKLGRSIDWPLNSVALEMLAVSILSDSLGLTTDGVTADSVHIIGELVENGVSLGKLDNARRDLMRKSPEIVRYKGELLQRIEYFEDNRIATITIPWEEIEEYSHAYNPSVLVLDDMRLTVGTDIAIAFKKYSDGKVTAKIRANYGKGIAGELAVAFGGGGHPYASGFKITSGKSFEDIKSECIVKAAKLLNQLGTES